MNNSGLKAMGDPEDDEDDEEEKKKTDDDEVEDDDDDDEEEEEETWRVSAELRGDDARFAGDERCSDELFRESATVRLSR